jgi:LacI family transcriptional regulator
MQAAREAGLRTPEDIAFVGSGNLRYAKYLRTPLTSVDQQPELLGVRAGELALELTTNPDLPPKTILLEPRLIVRQSTVADQAS